MMEITTAHGVRRVEPEPALRPGTGRAVLIGTVIGFFLVFGFSAGVGLAAGLTPVAAVALGAFTGVWGGPGFGGMMGFVLHESRHEGDAGTERAEAGG